MLYTRQNHLAIAKSKKRRIRKKRDKKLKELSPSPRCWLQILFFSWMWYLLLKVAPVFVPESFENTSYIKSSHWKCSVKNSVLRKTPVLKSLVNRVFRIATFSKSVSKTGVFLWNLRKLEEHLFWRKSVNDCFWNYLLTVQERTVLVCSYFTRTVRFR